MAEDTEVKFIVGSEGQNDYIVLAESDGAVLGVKPVLMVLSKGQGPYGVYVGLRIRSASASKPDTVISIASASLLNMVKPKSWAEKFPGITFDKVDKSRASAMMGLHVLRQPWQTVELMQVIKTKMLVTKMLVWIAKKVPEDQFILSPPLAKEWLEAKFEHALEGMGAAFPNLADDHDPDPGYLEDVMKTVGASKMPDVSEKKSHLSLAVDNSSPTDVDTNGDSPAQ